MRAGGRQRDLGLLRFEWRSWIPQHGRLQQNVPFCTTSQHAINIHRVPWIAVKLVADARCSYESEITANSITKIELCAFRITLIDACHGSLYRDLLAKIRFAASRDISLEKLCCGIPVVQLPARSAPKCNTGEKQQH